MALQLSKVTNTNATAVYHVISGINWSSRSGRTELNITVQSFVDQPAFAGNAQPLCLKTYTSISADCPNLAGAYTILQALPDFTGATIVS